MCRRQAGDGHPEGRAADVIKAVSMAQVDRGGVAAVLAADADFEVGTYRAPEPCAGLDELADAHLVDGREGVLLYDALLEVVHQEALLGVIARHPEGRLRQVVGAEAEELGLRG